MDSSTHRTLRLAACAAAALTLLSLPVAAQMAPVAVPNRIVAPINENSRVTLRGYVPPQANAANDRGVAPDSMPLEQIHLVLRRSAAQQAALNQLVTEQNTPGSANYHHWLTPTAFGQQFGPSDQDISTVESWLSSHGFEVSGVEPGKQVVEFSGSVAQMRNAFGVQIHQYEVNGSLHYSAANNPRIPTALAPVVGGFVSLNNFNLKSYAKVLGTATYNPQTGTAKPNWTYGNSQDEDFVVTPADFAVEYDLNPLYTAGDEGSGESIAIVNDSNVNIDLVNQFRTIFGLPANPPSVIIDGNDPGIDGINNPDGPNGDSIEAYLDVEMAGAVAPQAHVDLVIAGDTAIESGLTLAAEHAIYSDVAPIVSFSFGECEADLDSGNAFIDDLMQQAAAEGITVVVSSGDSGSAGCDNENTEEFAIDGLAVSGYASTPWNVAVGGTDFYYSDYASGAASIASYWNTTPTQQPQASLKSYVPEQPWNDSQYGLDALNYYDSFGSTTIAGGSGGASSAALCVSGSNTEAWNSSGNCAGTQEGYPKPSWQTGAGTQTDHVRDIPDVSLFASDWANYSAFAICASDGDCQTPSGTNLYQITGVGGTSASAPAFAGIMALVDEKYGPQGQADFTLYPLKTQYPLAFHDVTNGTNAVPCAGTTNCITVANGITVDDPAYGYVTEGETGAGATADYNATAGYNLATGLGSVDADVLVTDWGKVTFQSTTVTLTSPSAGASYTHGQSVTVTGSVTGSGTPTGNVALMTDSPTPLQQGVGVLPLTSGDFSSTVYYLPGGTYNIWAQYSGDGTNAAGASSKTQITVNPEASTTYFNVLNSAVTSSGYAAIDEPSGSSVPYGTQLILAAEIFGTTFYNDCVASGGTGAICQGYDPPTGTVVFKDNGTITNTAVLNAEGDAEYNAAFGVGNHSVTSSYAGDPGYKSSTGSAISFTVTKATPGIGLSASNETSTGDLINGQATVVNVQVENLSNEAIESNYGIGAAVPVAAPTGTVTVTGLPGGKQTATLVPANDPTDYFVEGVGTVTLPANAAAGTYTVTVSYSGDSNYAPVSGSGSITIAAPSLLSSTTTATMSGSISPNSSITVTGSVTGQNGHPAPTGGVILYSSGYDIGEIAFTSGSGDVSYFSVTLDSQDLFQGANFVTLQYTGDGNYNPSAFTLNSGSAVNSPLSDFSMVPNSVNIQATAGSSGTDTIQLSSVNGFSGSVSYTCAAASGVTCSVSPSSTAFSSGGTSTTAVTVNVASTTANGDYNVEVTGSDSTGEYIHTLGLTAIVAGSSNTGSAGFSLSNSGSISVAAGSTGTSTLTVSPANGFTGAVKFNCAISGTPTGLSCSAPSATVSGAASATSTLTATATSAATAGTYTATVTATDAATGAITASTTVSITVTAVTPAGSYALSSSGNISVTAGSSGTSTISVTPSNGFTGNIALSCSSSGASSGVTCSLSPAAADVTGTSAVTSTLTVTTTSSSAAARFPLQKFLTGAGGVMLAFVVFFGIPARRKSWHTILGLLVVVSVAAGISGCGSGGGGGGGGGQSASYTVTVTGTSGAISQSTAVTVTVTQ